MNGMFPHQVDAVTRLAKDTPTYIAFDMGLGKSRTFIEAVKVRGSQRVLVICPKSAVLVWQREIRQWAPHATVAVVKTPADLCSGRNFIIVTHGTLSKRDGDVAEYLALAPKFDMTCIDEAHAFNTYDTLRTKALRRALPKLGLVVPLSGTPMRNHAGDLYTLLAMLYPQALGKMTKHEFEDNFCRVKVINVPTGYGVKAIRTIEGSKNLDKLKPLIAPFYMRVKKDEVLKDLPPILWEVVPLDMDKVDMTDADYAALETYVSADGETLAPDSVHLSSLRQRLGLAKLRTATEYIVDMLDNLNSDRKVLVFAHHAAVIAALKNHLDEYNPAVITGSVTGKDRAEAVDKFLTEPSCRVFIGNIQAAGTALTLVGPKCKCSDVVFVESSWTPMDNAQAACRVHRIGQKDGVTARLLSAAGTVDDLIQRILARKAGEFTALFDSKGEDA